MIFSRDILGQDLWSTSSDDDVHPPAEQIQLHYDRAKAICKASGMSIFREYAAY